MAYRTIDALKALAVKCTSAESVSDVTGDTIDEVISYIEDNFNVNGEDGEDGDDGAYVTAIELVTTEGAVTGGTATLSDDTTVTITVTEAGE